ncbi:MAG: sulfate adenylyltransferase [Nautilia sp.]|nr:MAG: sulfate adenylyltransferase [Nautilia sp.]
MDLQKRNKLFIDNEAFITLSMMQEGLLYPVTHLMNAEEDKKVNETKSFNKITFPFSFILAPAGKKNEKILKQLKKDEIVDLYCENKKVGEIKTEEVFKIDKNQRIKLIYGSNDINNPNIARTFKRLGNYAISGKLKLIESPIKKDLQNVKETIKRTNAKNIVGIIANANPFHRVHERIIRLALENNDIVVLFLAKNLKNNGIDYETRYKVVTKIIDKFFPKNRVLIVPLHNTYIFAGLNEVIMDSLVIKNFGCNKFLIGQTHEGLGIHYENQKTKTIFDILKGINLETITINEYVYCDICKTMVSQNSCPHGSHHHINYHSEALLELLKNGIIVPSIMMRKEANAIYLSSLFKNRFNNLQKLYFDLIPNKGIIENHSEEELYIALSKLYQTTSMT